MKNLSLLSILCLMLSVFSCSQQERDELSALTDLTEMSDVDHFVFGKYHGHCLGNCTHAYKLKANGLFADKVERGYLEPTAEFEDKSLSKEKIELAAKLFKDLPKALFDEAGDTFGCPDCADQGGYYLEVQIGKRTPIIWRIDTNADQIPAYLSAYTARIEKTLEALKK